MSKKSSLVRAWAFAVVLGGAGVFLLLSLIVPAAVPRGLLPLLSAVGLVLVASGVLNLLAVYGGRRMSRRRRHLEQLPSELRVFWASHARLFDLAALEREAREELELSYFHGSTKRDRAA